MQIHGTKFKLQQSPRYAPKLGEVFNIFTVQPFNTSFCFLVDTGSVVSLIPLHFNIHPDNLENIKLFAANGTEIETFGSKNLHLSLANKIYSWNFIIAKVPKAIIGADFLSRFELLVDCKNKKIINKKYNSCKNDINIIYKQSNIPFSNYIPKTKRTTYCNSIYHNNINRRYKKIDNCEIN